MFADPENGTFYPLHALFRALGSWTGYLVSAFVLGASFTYAYVYTHTRSRTAAALSGVAFGLSEAMLERLPHPIILHGLAWVPLVLLALDRMRDARARWRWSAIGAIAAACCVLAGHPQVPVYAAYLSAAYVAAIVLIDRPGRAYVAAVGVMAATAVLLAAAVLLPLAELLDHTTGTAHGFEDFVLYSNTPAQMLSMLFPTIRQVGRETPTYVGLGVLALASLGAVLSPRPWRAMFWSAAAVICLVLGVGSATPLAALAYELPLYESFRIVARHLMFAALALAVLGGFGLAALQQRAGRANAVLASSAALLLAMAAAAAAFAIWPERVDFERGDESWLLPIWPRGVWIQFAVGLIACLACTAVARRPRSTAAAAVLVAVVAGDLLHAVPYGVQATGLRLESVPAAALEPSVHTRRLATGLAGQSQRALAPGGHLDNDLLPSVFVRAWRVPSAGGYSSLMLDRVAQMAMMSMTGRVSSRALAAQDAALDLLAVRYLVLPLPLSADDEAALGTDRWRLVRRVRTSQTTDRGADEEAPGEVDYVIFENRRALPRAWLTHEVRVLTDGAIEDAVRTSAFRDGSPFDPRQTALVEEGERAPLQREPGASTVRVTSIGDGEIVVTVSSAEGGFLVLSEAYYPGWQARVGEEPWRAVDRTDWALQGIEVPAGDQRVIFAFDPPARRRGLALSGAGLGLAGLLLAVSGARWPKDQHAAAAAGTLTI